MLQLIALFLEHGYSITFASTASVSKHSFALETLGVNMATVRLNDRSFHGFLKEINPTTVLFDRFITEEQFGWQVAETCPKAVTILDTEDLHFLRKAREDAYQQGSSVRDAYVYTDTAKRELASILRSDISLIISEVELQILIDIFKIPVGLLWYLPLLLTSEISEVQKQQQSNFDVREHFIAVGNLKHSPNVASIKILKNDIWPVLKKRIPQAELHIYGAYAPQQIQEMHQPKQGFLVQGWAEDISEVMQQARVQLAPLPFGAGIKGKLLDAMQYGLPTVTTPWGAEGMFTSYDAPGALANTWESFISHAEKVYTKKEPWLDAQQKGYKILADRFLKKLYAQKFIEKIEMVTSTLASHRERYFLGQILQHQTNQATKYLSKWIAEKNKH